ncbi:MAG: hypothetical protein R3F54_04930 [Alphaproteobacteria bacterium]
MEPATLAGSAVAILSPYLVKGSEAFAQKVGGAAFAGVEKLYGLVREKLAGQVEALEAAPADEDEQTLLRIQLKKALEADPAFAAELQAPVEDVKAKGGAPVTQILTITGDNNKGAQISGSGNTVNQ